MRSWSMYGMVVLVAAVLLAQATLCCSTALADSEPVTQPGFVMQVFGGVGVGTRDLEWSEDGERRRVETGPFAAYELAARFSLVLGESTVIGPELVYQSSLAHEVTETHVAAPAETIGVRAHRFAGLLAATFRFGEVPALYVAPALGYGVRNLRPDVHHLLIPSYSLAGPVARIAIRIAFAEIVGLRIAPEAQWILVGDALEEHGVESTGFSFGAEAALEFTLSPRLAMELTFREAHALLSARDGDASDVERFVTARLRWSP